ncbi:MULTISPECIES: RNA polymerase sigma factor [Proteiniphilum]|uniref:RNA polymerase sigma factor n=1 Tax=Proteiniphilum TaxID=294702 RepID=UPI0003605A2B|nr:MULTISPECIES: sigma-70 family RNA polymerase sigma factor [Proteiniphilum]SEA25545.1 RNA polymerase sigma factor, sigma-70 family [Porphyromonadaceae bacterium KH3R12]SFK42198.1 RNA polymerase sigma factor, sigma-70 family [Porphyromonadaceae bacterium KH3CP3RA]SFT08530.1 RNA polymerase sigma factor, sigma-70 family [Porphyromonadaceae bacterium NLAE-zl-C104]
MVSIDLSWRSFVEKGDEPSFSIIYNNHVDDLYSYGISLGFQKEMCKDAIQDTFYKLYISKDNLSYVKNVTAYIFKSFKHRLIDLSRKKIKEETLESVAESFTVQVTVLDNIIDSEDAEILKKKVTSLLNGLTPNQREVVYLKYMIGLGHKEIADVLDIREESARKLLYRTMEKLRQQVSEEDFPEVLSILSLLFLLR